MNPIKKQQIYLIKKDSDDGEVDSKIWTFICQ